VAPGLGSTIEYTLPYPKWQFLCHIGDRHNLMLHGSGNPDITEFEPRKSTDVNAFGNRRAVYASSDGIWAMFFAIVDRQRPVTSLLNTCDRLIDASGGSHPYYFFSINADALPGQPWRRGTVYLLPGDSFEHEGRRRVHGIEFEGTQCASLTPVRPLGRLALDPDDFPFLTQVRRHDPAALRARAYADPDGFPWLDEADHF